MRFSGRLVSLRRYTVPGLRAVPSISGPQRKGVMMRLQLLSKGVLGLDAARNLVLPAIIAALATLFLCLIFITKNMRALIAAKLERSLNAILGKSGVLAIVIGMMLTIAVQSSSITTSLMIPLFAAGILKLENGFPVTIGANIGTTVTAMLASMATNKAGLQIALVHLCFNLGATLIIYPIPQIRRIPIRCAEKLAEIAVKSKPKAAAYVMIVFILIPLLGYLVST